MKYIPFLFVFALTLFFTSCKQDANNESEKAALSFFLDSAVVDAKGRNH